MIYGPLMTKMYHTTKQVSLRLLTRLILMTIFIPRNHGDLNDLLYTRELMKSIIKVGVAVEGEIFPGLNLKRLCAFSKRRLFLDYIDEDHRPRVYTYCFQDEAGNELIERAVECGTVPSLYLRPGESPNRIIAASVQYPRTPNGFMKFKLHSPKPVLVRLVDRSPNLERSRLARLDHHSRQNICIEARNHVQSHFIDNFVFTAHTYEFVYLNLRATYDAIPCPTYPAMYLRLGRSHNEIVIESAQTIHQIEVVKKVKLIGNAFKLRQGELHSSSVPRKSRENRRDLTKKDSERPMKKLNKRVLAGLNRKERKALCIGASNHIAYRVRLREFVEKAAMFEFDYGRGLKEHRFAIPCSVRDDMFLYIDRSSTGGPCLKIVLIRSKVSKQASAMEFNFVKDDINEQKVF